MSETTIVGIVGRRVWDSRGWPTVEAEVHLAGGAAGRAIAPAGASTGRGEAVDLRDGGSALDGRGVSRAVGHVNTEIARALVDLDAADQALVDRTLVALDGTPDRHRLGANALIAVSMATVHAAAAAARLPLWRYLAAAESAVLPLPQVQIFGGGAHAARRVDVQDYMVVPLTAASFDQALQWVADIHRAAGRLLDEAGGLAGAADEGGYWPAFATNEEALAVLVRAIERAGFRPGVDVGIALDMAASQLWRDGRYHLALEGRDLDPEAWITMLSQWTERYPIVSVEDPLGEHDLDALARFTADVGSRVQVVGDDPLVTSAERVRAGAAAGACNALLVKPNQTGTLTEARAALDAACAAGWGTIVSARSGETEDVTIVHLAVGWSVGQLKVGGFARSERMAKWNEALRIEQALEHAPGGRTRFAGAAGLARYRAAGCGC